MVCAHIRNKSHNNFIKLTVIFRAVILIDLLCCLDVTTNLSRCYISHFPLARNTSCLFHPSPTATFSFSKGSSGFWWRSTFTPFPLQNQLPTPNNQIIIISFLTYPKFLLIASKEWENVTTKLAMEVYERKYLSKILFIFDVSQASLAMMNVYILNKYIFFLLATWELCYINCGVSYLFAYNILF